MTSLLGTNHSACNSKSSGVLDGHVQQAHLAKSSLSPALRQPGELGDFLAVQWSRLGTFTATAWVQSLVGELRYHKQHGTGKKPGKLKLEPLTSLTKPRKLKLSTPHTFYFS